MARQVGVLTQMDNLLSSGMMFGTVSVKKPHSNGKRQACPPTKVGGSSTV